MRTKDEPQIFGAGKCGFNGCLSAWAVYCKGCNGVLCGAHLDRGMHGCANRDNRSQVAENFTFPGDPALRRGVERLPVQKNGRASANGSISHGSRNRKESK